MFVHYNASPIVGDYVLPWDELPPDLRMAAGHEARVHERPAYRHQWRSDRVHVIELTDEALIFSIGTGYANPEHWVYEVEPVGPLEADPEVRGHHLSRLCAKARVIRCLNDPLLRQVDGTGGAVQ